MGKRQAGAVGAKASERLARLGTLLWWEAFLKLPVNVQWVDGAGPADFREGAKRIAGVNAVFADEMIAEAKRRGRL
jgi:hypothetical protein